MPTPTAKRLRNHRSTIISRTIDWQALLRTAIESSSHGLCIFDNQLRLVIANEHHRSMYGLTRKSKRDPDCSIHDILKSRLAQRERRGRSEPII